MTIDLASGYPSPALIPVYQLQQAANTALSTPSIWKEGLKYGADAGYFPLRHSLAQWLTDFYNNDNTKPDAERICVTGGASQNLACILQVYTDPVYTKKIFIIEPAYFLSFRVFEDAGFGGRLKGIPEDDQGIDLAILEQSLKKEADVSLPGGSVSKPFKQPQPHRKLYRHVIYCVPTFSNPSGRVMSLNRRRELVRLARKYDALIVADDVYDFVHWEIETNNLADVSPTDDLTSSIDSQSSTSTPTFTPPSSSTSSLASLLPTMFKSIMPRLVDVDKILDGGPVDQFGNCVSNGSFSKIVGPGCRVGWAEGSHAFVYGLSQVGSTRSGGAPSQLASTFINGMLENGCITEHIQNILVPAYARRSNKLSRAIKEHLGPIGVTLPSWPSGIPNTQVASESTLIGGGFFIWLQLPSPLNSKEVAAAALLEGLSMGQGTSSALPDGNDGCGQYGNMLRLCFACEEEDLLLEAILILHRVILKCLSNASTVVR
ncbi:hypothetical protein UA08_07108 [Talaromyces atroroseus]|uniref:Aminotransferase class I/classII large domain-containing protein n=1 Tax=Talaromyces atroroseus TaxID=1441469 RepID=A0A225AS05_TALAT|nr:hypothetical protein UA08_07108 [Talaromyces atroroseus]OKL57746.1 hypothetical protein UA08_07108 [Talaromyces atroroseus]